jgi:hypothetical protein
MIKILDFSPKTQNGHNLAGSWMHKKFINIISGKYFVGA